MVKRSPQDKDACTSGVLRGFPKTWAPSEWLEQSMKPTSSAQAAEAARKLAPKRIRNRLRNIAPSSARGHTEPLMLLSGLETSAPTGRRVRLFQSNTGRKNKEALAAADRLGNHWKGRR